MSVQASSTKGLFFPTVNRELKHKDWGAKPGQVLQFSDGTLPPQFSHYQALLRWQKKNFYCLVLSVDGPNMRVRNQFGTEYSMVNTGSRFRALSGSEASQLCVRFPCLDHHWVRGCSQ